MKELLENIEADHSLVTALALQDIKSPSEVQRRTLPEAVKRKDLLVESPTGTGKSLAFLLSLFKLIDPEKKEMQALILAPSHELVLQIHKQAEFLSENSQVKINSLPLLGNVNIQRQIEKLRDKPQLLIASPGRSLDLIKKRKISAHTIKTIVVDEADKLSDKNNLQLLEEIIKGTLKDRQLMFFSATISEESKKAAGKMMVNPFFIKIQEESRVPKKIEHFYIKSDFRQKTDTLRRAIHAAKPVKAIVFAGEKGTVEIINDKLGWHKIKVAALHGRLEKEERKKIMEDFRTGRINIIIASDLAARGLDFQDLDYIFSLDLPHKAEDYLHRAGRTGRFGKAGKVLSIVTEKEIPYLKAIEKELKIKIDERKLKRGRME